MNLKPLQMVGEISYGVYLIHTFIFFAIDRCLVLFFPRLPPLNGHFSWMVARFCIAVIVTFGVSYISRWYFEERFLQLKSKFGA